MPHWNPSHRFQVFVAHTEQRLGSAATYRGAIAIGQREAPCNYRIDSGDYVPTREEQLGEMTRQDLYDSI